MLFFSRTCVQKRKFSGVTLFEIVVTLCLISVMTTLFWPALRSLYQHQTARRVLSAIEQQWNQARLAALIENKKIRWCLSDDGMACSALGRHDALRFMGEAGFPQRVFPLQAGQLTLHWQGRSERQGELIFLPDQVTNASLWACDPKRLSPVWVLRISLTGVMREAWPKTHEIVKDSEGRLLSCNTA